MHITNIPEPEEDSLLLTLFDTNLIQNIFIKLFKKYKYKLQKKTSTSSNQNLNPKEADYKKKFFKMNNFKIVCKIFNNISKQTLFNLNIYNTNFKIPYNLYFKLTYIQQIVDRSYYQEKNIDMMLIENCKNGFYDLIPTFVEEGKLEINKTYYNRNPLLEATRNNNIKTIKELFKFKNLNINIQNYTGTTPLMEAYEKKFQNLIKLFISRNDTDLNIQDITGRTILINAVKENKENIVTLILSRNDVNLNLQDTEGDTALIHAIEKKNKNIVTLILSRNDINLNLKNNENRTALDYAKRKNNQKIIKMIQNYEKKFKKQFFF